MCTTLLSEAMKECSKNEFMEHLDMFSFIPFPADHAPVSVFVRAHVCKLYIYGGNADHFKMVKLV